MLRTAALLLVGGALGMLGAHAADPAAGAYMYGISRESSTGTFWIDEFNPVKQEEAVAFDTGIASALGDANALALDTGRNQLLFVAGDDVLSTLKLYVFDITTKTLNVVAPYTALGLANPVGIWETLNNAAFYDDAYWYFYLDTTNILTKVTLTYTNGLPTGVASVNTYTIDNSGGELDNQYWSDIAINPLTQTLYACGEPLFSVSLANLAAPLPLTVIGGPLDSYQCAFTADHSTLWGFESGSGEGWFTVDLQTGAHSPYVWESALSPDDLGGSSFLGLNGVDCSTQTVQYAAVKASAAKSAKRGSYLRYHATVRIDNKNKTAKSTKNINNLRLEVTLPPELSLVYSSSKVKQGTTAIEGPSSVTWRPFNVTRHRAARFGLKLRVDRSAAPGQVLALDTTLYQEVSGAPVCPKSSNLQVRVKK